MARRSHDDALGVAGAATIIGSGVTVKGDLVSESDITVDGTLDGNITTIGDITLGVNAIVTAQITGSNVTVAGHLTGNITATGETVIRETGQVEGDISSAGLSIIPGGVFVGRNVMQVVSPLEHGNGEPSAKPVSKPTKLKP